MVQDYERWATMIMLKGCVDLVGAAPPWQPPSYCRTPQELVHCGQTKAFINLDYDVTMLVFVTWVLVISVQKQQFHHTLLMLTGSSLTKEKRISSLGSNNRCFYTHWQWPNGPNCYIPPFGVLNGIVAEHNEICTSTHLASKKRKGCCEHTRPVSTRVLAYIIQN